MPSRRVSLQLEKHLKPQLLLRELLSSTIKMPHAQSFLVLKKVGILSEPNVLKVTVAEHPSRKAKNHSIVADLAKRLHSQMMMKEPSLSLATMTLEDSLCQSPPLLSQ
jgi:hypothetical protein